MEWLPVVLYWVYAFTQALTLARYWYRLDYFDRGDMTPKSVFLLSFFFAPIASIFTIVCIFATGIVWCINRWQLDEVLDRLIQWKNK